jgi:hypothetical protein
MSHQPMSGMFQQPSWPSTVNMGGLSMLGGGGGNGAGNTVGLYGNVLAQSPLNSAGGSYANFGTQRNGVPTNATVTMSRRVDCSEGLGKAKGDLDYMGVFISHTDDLNTQVQQRAMSVHHQLLHDKASVMKSLGAMNYFLRTEQGRRKFGGEVSCKKLDDWARPDSFQMTELNTPNISEAVATQMVVTTAVHGRVRGYNFCLAGATTKPGIGNYAYLVLKRFPADKSRYASNAPLRRIMDDDPSEEEVKTTEKKRSSGVVSMSDNDKEAGRQSAVPDHFWQYVPMFCHQGDKPAPCLWHVDGESEGKYYFMGYISVPHERDYDLEAQSNLAKKAVFPTTDNPKERASAISRLIQTDFMFRMVKG